MDVAAIFPTAKAWPGQDFHLRMRRRIDRRRANSVPRAVLSLRDNLFDLRRRGRVSRAIRGRIYWFAVRSVYRGLNFSSAPHRRTCLGVGQGMFAMAALARSHAG